MVIQYGHIWELLIILVCLQVSSLVFQCGIASACAASLCIVVCVLVSDVLDYMCC